MYAYLDFRTFFPSVDVSLLIFTPVFSVLIVVCLYIHSCFAIIMMGKRDLVALLGLSSLCLVIVVWLFLAVPWVCLRFVIVVFPDHNHLLFWSTTKRFYPTMHRSVMSYEIKLFI